MSRQVLLVEPDYKNKYPPLGLMKLASYFKRCGDDVRFFKGDLAKFEVELMLEYSGPIARFDLICVTSLFTFYWDKIVATVNQAKKFLKLGGRLLVGGIAASLLPDEMERETGAEVLVGLLDRPGAIDSGNSDVIDELPPDYSILDEIDYMYPVRDSYIAYMTRGCVRNCAFCVVNQIEPEYKSFISLRDKIEYVDEHFGPRRNLLLLDNNVLASRDFDRIVDEIKACGFQKGATFGNTKRVRYVDFNQGLDARLADDYKMQRLAELNLRPVRIAFDHWEQHDVYEKAVECAARAGFKSISNYVLFNFEDRPEELYQRLSFCFDLSKRLGVRIYSFSMKYQPISDVEYCKNRSFVGPHWTRKFLRAVQGMMVPTRGVVPHSRRAFECVFGHDLDDFMRNLWLPECLAIRKVDHAGLMTDWDRKFFGLDAERTALVRSLVSQNTFTPDVISSCTDVAVREVLNFYTA